ncbi:MAG: hypothetical protein OIF55_16975, partial [Amphritea sp.]|nr:hypothetical protein [Amphritea sp.]
GFAGDDHLRGGAGEDTYRYSLGDGNDHILDYKTTNGDAGDRIVLRGLNPDDVEFSQNSDEDLVITLANGERITVEDHFGQSNYLIEEVEFADGTVLSEEGIRNKSVADQKDSGSGLVRATQYAETFTHSLGDGTYQIVQGIDNRGRVDRLEFTDVNAADVAFASTSDEDLVITLSNGEQITIKGHFGEGTFYAIDEIQFSDGSVLGLEGIRAKSIADQKAGGSGTVIGTDHADTYEHTLGDGSYRITDWDNNGRTDRLYFTDVNATDVQFSSPDGIDLVITLSNGEQITVSDHFHYANLNAVEQIEFSDGTILNTTEIRAKSIADQKLAGTGTVIGTNGGETYSHTLGDGSYRINELGTNDSGADRLVFTDAASDSVEFNRLGSDLRITLSNGEVVLVADQLGNNTGKYVESFEFADGVSWSSADVASRVVDWNAADKIGTDANETYTHTRGDGSYVISEANDHGSADNLTFTDVNSDQVTLGRSGNNLTIRLDNGELITIQDQFLLNNNVMRHVVETVTFADGITLDQHELRNQMVADMKAGGIVIGTEYDEAYVHTMGDGSYTIADYDYSGGSDSLTFMDVNAEQITLGRVGNDLTIQLDNGEQITIKDQFLLTNGVMRHTLETVTFSDGTTLDQHELRNRMVSDMKAKGIVVGTEYNEAYVHTTGDGSYSIADYDYSLGSDNLTFTDVNADQVTLGRSGNNLVIRLDNGEQVTLVDQFLMTNGAMRHAIETVTFADGTTLDHEDMRNRLVSDMKSGGTVIGSDNDESYFHTRGDGSYSITDYEYRRGNDSLTFTDANADQVSLSRSGNDLVIRLDNGEQITIERHLDVDAQHSIETLIFADGTTLNGQEQRDRMVSDMKDGGTVIGTENNEAYVHTMGDGSYSITDYDYRLGADSLAFTDVNADDLYLTRIYNDVVINLPNGETITLIRQLDGDQRHSIELFEFADGSTWDQVQLRNRLMHDMKSTGAVIGTENDETYTHTSGDGSYSITDYDYYRGNDRLVFTDV